MNEVAVDRETLRRFHEWCRAEAAGLTGWREDSCLPEQDMTPDAATGRRHRGMPVPIPPDADGPGWFGDAATVFAGRLVDAAKQHRALLEGLNALGAIAAEALSEMDGTDSLSAQRLDALAREHLTPDPAGDGAYPAVPGLEGGRRP